MDSGTVLWFVVCQCGSCYSSLDPANVTWAVEFQRETLDFSADREIPIRNDLTIQVWIL